MRLAKSLREKTIDGTVKWKKASYTCAWYAKVGDVNFCAGFTSSDGKSYLKVSEPNANNYTYAFDWGWYDIFTGKEVRKLTATVNEILPRDDIPKKINLLHSALVELEKPDIHSATDKDDATYYNPNPDFLRQRKRFRKNQPDKDNINRAGIEYRSNGESGEFL